MLKIKLKNGIFGRTLKSKKGETLIEVVISIALFGITMLMLTTMIGTSNRIYMKNLDQEQAVDEVINASNSASWEPEVGGMPYEEITFTYNKSPGEYKTVKVKVKRYETTDSENKVSIVRFGEVI